MTGLVGGTFDPIHLGHLDIARAAVRVLPLDRVLFIPAHVPPHRGAPQASGDDRLAMVKLAIAADEDFDASRIELDAPGPSYTAVTIDRLTALGLPGADLCFVSGADAFAGIERWHDFPRLLDRCHFAVVSRPGLPVADLPAHLPTLAARMVTVDEKHPYQRPSQPSIFLIDAVTTPVSSTDVRAAIDRHAPLTGLVPEAVADYIGAHRLYARGDAARMEAHGR